MSTNVNNRPSIVMDTTDEQCNIFPQDFPTDILLQVCESSFPLHKASNEANFPSSPPNWWAEELSNVHITFFRKITDSMRSQGAKEPTIAEAITVYAKRSLPDLVTSIKAPISNGSNSRIKQREILASIVALMPTGNQQTFFSINFLCCLLRTAIFVESDDECKMQLENQISGVLEHVTVDDFLTLSYTFDGEKLGDMASVRRIVTKPCILYEEFLT